MTKQGIVRWTLQGLRPSGGKVIKHQNANDQIPNAKYQTPMTRQRHRALDPSGIKGERWESDQVAKCQ
jgi:hypothetical protein